MFGKLKTNFIDVVSKKSYKIATMATTGIIAVNQAVFAADETVANGMDGIVDSMTSTFSSVSSVCMSAVAAIAPVGVTIFGLMFVWKKGIQFFKKLTQG